MAKNMDKVWNDIYNYTDVERDNWYAMTDGMYGDLPDCLYGYCNYLVFLLVNQQQVGDFLMFLKKSPTTC